MNTATTLQLRMKKLVPEAVVPAYAKPGDAGLDLTATSVEFDETTRKLKVGFVSATSACCSRAVPYTKAG